jgi:uncharacterized protein (TIGR02301 family)
MIARRLATLLCIAAVAGPACAQDAFRRPGVERSVVVELAYTLGEAHALQRLCAGPADATWYARMQRLIAQEAYDASSRRQLVDSFNAGFAASSGEYTACSRRSRGAEAAVAERGRALAEQLAAPGEP